MKIFAALAGLLLAGLCAWAGPALAEAKDERAPAKSLRAFSSDEDLAAFFAKELLPRWQAERKRQRERLDAMKEAAKGEGAVMASPAEDTPASDESVTNVQHAGVDEGGIVKLHGNHLVVLRRGRLFTVDIGAASAPGGKGVLRPASVANAYGQDIDPSGTWYDEMLISGDTIFVIGYSYSRGGTEIGLFTIDDKGELSYRSTYHLRSADYYSARNFASRLVEGKLVFYTPLPLGWRSPRDDDFLRAFPALRKWRKGATLDDFRLTAPARKVYKPLPNLDLDVPLALHSVTTCEAKGGDLNCESSAVIGPWGRVFYVSPKSVYVWTTGAPRRSSGAAPGQSAVNNSVLYRLPLDGSAPSALVADGSPVDQFSFLESGDGFLNVLVGSSGGGDGMWRSENSRGRLGLLRIPPDGFADGSTAAPAGWYRRLSGPDSGALQNRYVGEYLLYGSSYGSTDLRAVRWENGQESPALRLGHQIERIEALGKHALVAGNEGKDLRLTGIRLGSQPSVASSYTRANAVQGEQRSHGFFYKPGDADNGLLGLPVVASRQGRSSLQRDSAFVLFLRNNALQLAEIGELAAKAENRDDGCKSSCVDWYGNARPLFIRGRIFALLGYEIVEGKLTEQGRMGEAQRVNFAPRGKTR